MSRSHTQSTKSESLAKEVSTQRGSLLRLAYRFCWNIDDAEDAVQNALLLAAKKQDQLEDSGKLWSWIRTIVIRQCHEVSRRIARTRKTEDSSIEQHNNFEFESTKRSDAEQKETAELIRTMLKSLPEKQQTAITLRHLEELSYAEIAEIMDISESTARVQVRNGRESLRKAVLRHDPRWTMD